MGYTTLLSALITVSLIILSYVVSLKITKEISFQTLLSQEIQFVAVEYGRQLLLPMPLVIVLVLVLH